MRPKVFFALRQLIAGDVRLLQRCLLIFHLLLQRFHRLGEGFDLLAQSRTSDAVAEAVGAGVCAKD